MAAIADQIQNFWTTAKCNGSVTVEMHNASFREMAESKARITATSLVCAVTNTGKGAVRTPARACQRVT